MPRVLHGDVWIHYSVQGQGPPVVLHHGTAGNRTSFIRYGYARALRERHTLILIDARGHGDSSKPHAPEAHTLALRVGDVTAVLDALGVERAHFVGYSMGGWVGYGMALHAPDRLSSLAVGGAHPYADPDFPRLAAIDARDPEAFLEGMQIVIGEPLSPETRRLLVQNDLEAVMATLRQRVSVEGAISAIRVPCWLFAGTADRRYALIQRAAEAIPGADLFSLADLGHLQTLASADQVLPPLCAFLERCAAG